MSLGGSKTTKSNQSTTTSLDPAYKALVYGNANRVIDQANTPYQPYTGSMVAPFTPDQTAAQNLFEGIASNQTGQAALDQATKTATGVTGYQPMTVKAPVAGSQGYNPASATASNATTSLFDAANAAPLTLADPASATAATLNRGDVRDLTAGQLAGTDLSPYMDPYIADVVKTTQDALNRQAAIQKVANAAQTTKLGGFGGTGGAVLDAETNKNTLDTFASTVAQLMSQGYTQAQAQAVADINRKLTADTSNQGVDLSVAGTNTGNEQQTNLFNATNDQNASIFNATQANDAVQAQAARDQAAAAANAGAANNTSIFNAGQGTQVSEANAAAKNAASEFGAAGANTASLANASTALQAALANQGAIAQGAQIQLQGANLLGSLSTQDLTDALTRAGALQSVGLTQQQQQQAALNFAYQNNYIGAQEYQQRMDQLTAQALGLVPATGTTNQTGKTTETTTPGLFGAGGLISGIAGGIGSAVGGIGQLGSLFAGAAGPALQIAGSAASIPGAGSAAFSDENLKEDVRTVGYDSKGRRWVDFRYTFDPDTVRRGVIAQEVERTDPDAVSESLFGVKMVDYSKLLEAA